MDNEVGILSCTVSLEQLKQSGEVEKKTLHKNTKLVLGRNEFRDVMLKVFLNKREMKYRLCDIVVFKKFAKEGKATLRLKNQNMQFLLSNCPPDQLIIFLKTLTTKVECLKVNGTVSDRKRLLSDKQKIFQEISPLNMKELETVHNARQRSVEAAMFTPKGKTGMRKRPRGCDDKENIPPKSLKLTSDRNGNILTSSNPHQIVINPVILSKEQQHVLGVVKTGRSVFFTGSAGTGKSFLLRRIIGSLSPQHTFATASTGVAACHIGGTTLHAFAGIGSGRGPVEQCYQLASRPQVMQNWKKCKHLIIDEISMVDGEFFDKLEIIARMVRQTDEPFGGIQLILCGDFLQLPPVSKGAQKKRFAFQSRAWDKCVQSNLELSQVKRQSDQRFIKVLQNIRLGRCPKDVIDVLSMTSKNEIEKDGIQATRLCTHKEDVDHINDFQIKKLTGQSRWFMASDSDVNLVKTINQMCPVEQKIELKLHTQVMLTKNVNVQKGLANGARGIVTGFESDATGYPIVKFLCGEKAAVRPEKWVFRVPGGVLLSRKQLPLKLAWSISIHKSQGMSLDCVEMSLSKVFECGQAYVALSRARSLEGLRVVDFDRNCVRADESVLKFYKKLNMAGSALKSSSQTVSSQNHW